MRSLSIITLLVLMLASFVSRAEVSQRVRVVEPFIPLYTGPGVGYPVFLDLERGSWLNIQRQQADWYEVTTDKSDTGWVKRDDLAKTVTADNQTVELYDERQADFIHRDWELGALWGEAGDASIFTLSIGFVFTNHLAAELSASQMIGSLSTSELLDINLIAQPFPEWRVSPYFTMGTGRIKTKTNATLVQEKDRDDRTASVGLGIRAYLTRSFFLRAEYKELVIFTSTNEYEELEIWSIGVGSFF